MIAFDTDMIGPYGYCADLTRSWTCGYTPISPAQRDLYNSALEQIHHNAALLLPGLSFREFNSQSWRIPDRHVDRRYSLALHGVGMADEWPAVPLHPDFGELAMDGRFEPGMVVCVEGLIGAEGTECVKLETQMLITDAGAERLDAFPWEDVA
jgi:Xaa-Pro aminopeptidase